jgi:hypothetical protein
MSKAAKAGVEKLPVSDPGERFLTREIGSPERHFQQRATREAIKRAIPTRTSFD